MTARRAGLGRDAAYGVLALGLERAVALGIALYLPRHLALGDYGRYAFLVSYLGLFQGLPDASFESVLVARLAGARPEGAVLAGRARWVRLAVSLAGAALGLALLGAVAGDRVLVGAGAVAATGFAVAAANPYRALLRARLAMGRYLALLALQAAVALLLLALVVRGDGGLAAVLGAVAAASLAGLPLGRLLAGGGTFVRPDGALARALVGAAWPLAASALVVAGGQQVLQLLLLRLHGAPAVGLYGGAQKLVEAAGLLPQALMVSVLPAIAAAAASGAEAARTARDAARLLVVLLVPVAAVMALWAEPVLVRAFGPAFGAAALVLRVLAAVVVLAATGAVLTNLLVATGHQRTLFAATSATAAVMALLGTALVPRHGGVGAAAAVAAAMLGGQLVLLVPPATRVLVRPVLVDVLRPLGLGAVVTALAAAAGGAPLLGLALLGLGYPAALVATGTVTRADLLPWRSA